ncbi:MAG TPA: cell division protein ZapB [Bryobacteraceae bacterium]|jgi:FtsZ-binding cell division protein ZapB|nr:cell division protein ZapB [Bryobacteraceae bacterium]
MEAAQAVQVGSDALASLEERITRAVQVLTAMRNENEQLQRDKHELQQKVQQLSEEVDALRGERKQVKTRIEKLLTQLDLLSAS